MRFNGTDPETIHHAVSVNKEIYPSTPDTDIAVVETTEGDLVANVNIRGSEATIRLNIAARTYDEAMEARLAIAEWAAGRRNRTAELEPTHLPGKAYGAILDRITPVEQRFAPVDVVFMLPRPILHETTVRKISGTGTQLTFRTGGSAPTAPALEITTEEDTQELWLEVDGVKVFAIGGGVNAGQNVSYDMKTGRTTVDGASAENRILYVDINPDAELLPGKHTLTTSTAGTLTVRWQNEWL